MSKIFTGLLLGLILLLGNSCSTGADPEPEILDIFMEPAIASIQIHNILNDMAMEVNGIAMHNLDFEGTTIEADVNDCVEALVYRNTSTSNLDSIVLNYGTENCVSNGANFIGKIIVDPINEALSKFDIRVSDFTINNIIVGGTFELEITSVVKGSDFVFKAMDANFSLLMSDETRSDYAISSLVNEYSLFANQDDSNTYVDDVFKFTSSFSGETPDGLLFSIESIDGENDLCYAYTCTNIIGGKANFSIVDLGEGTINYGGGDPAEDDDCNARLILSVAGKDNTITL